MQTTQLLKRHTADTIVSSKWIDETNPQYSINSTTFTQTIGAVRFGQEMPHQTHQSANNVLQNHLIKPLILIFTFNMICTVHSHRINSRFGQLIWVNVYILAPAEASNEIVFVPLIYGNTITLIFNRLTNDFGKFRLILSLLIDSSHIIWLQ